MMRNRRLLLSIAMLVIIINAFSMIAYAIYISQPIEEEDKLEFFLHQWMDYIDDSAYINQIIMPGSHDAASYGMAKLGETQANNIYEQLCNGVRYFDIRVKSKNDKLVIYHGIVTGVEFAEVVADIKRFILERPTQFLILDFKLYSNVRDEVAAILSEELNFTSYALRTEHNVNEMTIGDIRNLGCRYIALFDTSIPEEHKEYLHRRSNNLISPYSEYYHYLDKDNLIIEGFPKYLDKTDGTKLFVLQCQRTANIIISPRQLEDKFIVYINEYLDKIEAGELLDKLNIIMRDYVDVDMNNIKLILMLNYKKELVKPHLYEEFVELLNRLIIPEETEDV